jgi:predicted  nucleic acid-binding Zn-ribbon protein
MEMAATIGDGIKDYIKQIEKENRALKQTLDENTKQYNERVIALETENRILAEKLKLALFRQFGRASERFIGEGQLSANLRFDVWE